MRLNMVVGGFITMSLWADHRSIHPGSDGISSKQRTERQGAPRDQRA